MFVTVLPPESFCAREPLLEDLLRIDAPRTRNEPPLVAKVHVERSHDRIDEESHSDAEKGAVEDNRLENSPTVGAEEAIERVGRDVARDLRVLLQAAQRVAVPLLPERDINAQAMSVTDEAGAGMLRTPSSIWNSYCSRGQAVLLDERSPSEISHLSCVAIPT